MALAWQVLVCKISDELVDRLEPKFTWIYYLGMMKTWLIFGGCPNFQGDIGAKKVKFEHVWLGGGGGGGGASVSSQSNTSFCWSISKEKEINAFE